MNAYLDTSVIVKFYVSEPGADEAKSYVKRRVEKVITSEIAYIETRLALARKRLLVSSGVLTRPPNVADFEKDWEGFTAIGVYPHIVRLAAQVGERLLLRTLDAIHLASAQTFKQESGLDLIFLSADKRLTAAAEAEGLRTILIGA